MLAPNKLTAFYTTLTVKQHFSQEILGGLSLSPELYILHISAGLK